MTSVNMDIVLYTYNDATSLELMEATIPTMSAIQSKLEAVTVIVDDWAQNIVKKLPEQGGELSCSIKVVESTNIAFNITILLNGTAIVDIPAEYIAEFNRGMPLLIGKLYEELELNFDVKFTAMNYIASDMREEMRNKVAGLNASYTLGSEQGWYKIAESAVGINNCIGIFSLVVDGNDNSETIVFSAGTSYGKNGNIIQQIQRSRIGTDITAIRLVIRPTSVRNPSATVEVYKQSNVERTIHITVVDGTGFTLNETSVIDSEPTQSTYLYYTVNLKDGGMIAMGLTGLESTIEELNYSQDLVGNIQTQLNSKAPINHSSDTDEYGKSSDVLYGHTIASSTIPLQAQDIPDVGTEVYSFARGDHIHPVQTTISGNAGSATKLETGRFINIDGAVEIDSPVKFDGTSDITLNATVLDSTKLSGLVPIECIPPAAIEKLVIVANDTARFKLTPTQVQQGDTVKVMSTQKMYYVVDETKLNVEAGYEVYIAGAASSVPWLGVTDKPATFTPSQHSFNHAMGSIDEILPSMIGAEPEIEKHTAFNVDFEEDENNLQMSGIPSVGILETVARADHVHPAQIDISGNAGTATTFETARTIGISGGATGTATSFDGSKNITIPVTALDESKLSSAVAIARGGTGATTAADALTNLGLTATATELNYCDGVTSAIQTQLNGKEASFTKNSAFNKNFEGTASNIKVAGTASVGTLSTVARADHVHPAQTSVTGNAGTATTLKTARTIGISGGATGTATSFNGSANITIPVTALDESKLSSAVAIARGGTGATTADGALTNLGLTATATELNYCDGVTSAIQTQLDGKEASFTKNSAFNRNFESNASNIKVAGTASVGSLFTVARADHVHPVQTSVTGNAGTATTLKNARTIGISGGATGTATSFNGSSNITIPVTSLDATKLSGVVPIECIPPAAIERLVIVQDDEARFKLTVEQVQLGDTVKVADTGKMYFVIDVTKLSSEDGYSVYTAGSASSVQWSGIIGKPSSFTPSVHANTHASGGDDELTPSDIGAEPAFAKNSAFNKKFETNSSNIKEAGIASVGTLSTVARADHVHPAQTTVSGNAGSATKLATARTIGISGGATGTATSFDGSKNITIPVTALDESKLSSAVAIARGGTGATTAAGALTNLGLTATATELNYCDGVTSAIQTQLNGKETSFTKNTAFNKNFESNASNIKGAGIASVGTLSTVARADHVHPAQGSGVLYGVSETNGNIASKIVNVNHFELSTGVMLNILFTKKNTATDVTLNVNNTGAYPILSNGVSFESINDNIIYPLIFTGSAYVLQTAIWG